MSQSSSVAIVGTGDYIGAAIARRFAAEGYDVHGGRRRGELLAPLAAEIAAAGGRFTGHSLDARSEESLAAFLAAAEVSSPLELVVFNIGANVQFPLLDTTERVFRKVWEMACLAGFLTGREAARRMLVHGRGSIFFTGATASLRGGSGYAAFAAAKAGLRATAQAMARELGPKNIHVAHLVIDAGVDTAWVRERIAAARPDAKIPRRGADGSGVDRRHLSDAPPPAARRVDPRTRPAAKWRKLVSAPIFLFDFASPNAFLVHRILPEIETRTRTTFVYRPVLLGGLFKLTGNQAPMITYAEVPARLAYDRREIERFIARHNLAKFRMNPHFPVNTLAIMRGAVAAEAEAEGVAAAYIEAMFHYMWEDPRDLSDPAVIADTLAEAGLPAALLARVADPAVKDQLLANTRAAAEAGAFGLPSFLIGDELYFGKNTLAEVEEAIATH